jgi:pyruvate formate lyase activating enzyme
MKTLMGVVFDIKHYAIHDGPGIRTTVFLKGCPLNCAWCHNPESKRPQPEFMWWPTRCIGCRSCVEGCPEGAVNIGDRLVIDETLCVGCGVCVEGCYAEALELVGVEMSVEEVMEEVLRDSEFYRESGGGVTFSGGEPLMQPLFLAELLKACRGEGLHTAVDTSGHADPAALENIIDHTDLFLYDVKHMDPERHRSYTGATNELALSNLALLRGREVVIRAPIVPGVNDDEENIGRMGEYVSGLGFTEICLLPYHRVGSEKAQRLNRETAPPFVAEPPTEESLERLREVLTGYGLNVKIGG